MTETEMIHIHKEYKNYKIGRNSLE